jgi:parvulin-like peptidyl-prolyl isomerase
MKRNFPLLSIFFLAIAAVGAQVASHAPTVFTATPDQAPAPAVKVVARVNGSALTDADLVREEYAIFPYARQHNGIPKDLEPQIRSGALKMIIFEELVYQEALRSKLTIPPAKMQQAEADFRKQFATPDEFDALLQNEFHGSQQMLREKVRRSLLIDTFLHKEIENKCQVSPAEVRAYYDQNPARFEQAESFTFQTISFMPPAKAAPDQSSVGRKRAQDALRQAKATKSSEEFGLLAEKISEDDYRVMMGQHKPLPVNELAPQVLKALNAMKPGDVTDVIQIDQIYTIIRLGAHTQAGKAKFEDVKPQLEKELPQTKRNQLRAALDKKLRENAKIDVL